MREVVAPAAPSSCGGAWPDARRLSAALGTAAQLSAGLRRAVASDCSTRPYQRSGREGRAGTSALEECGCGRTPRADQRRCPAVHAACR
jgi:hypothetical protein